MKRFITLCVLITILSFSCLNVAYAEEGEDTNCSYASKAKLSKASSRIKMMYDIKTGEDGNYYFDFSVYNISEELAIRISNNVNSENYTVVYSETNNGTYSFRVNDTISIIEYTAEVVPVKYGCTGELRKVKVIKPKYNNMFDQSICKNEDVVDSLYCQQWTTKHFKFTKEEIISKLNETIKKKGQTTTTKCSTCEYIDKKAEEIARLNKTRYSLIIGSLVGMIMDGLMIAYLIFRMKRYEI